MVPFEDFAHIATGQVTVTAEAELRGDAEFVRRAVGEVVRDCSLAGTTAQGLNSR